MTPERRAWPHHESCDIYDRPPEFGQPATGDKPCNCYLAEITALTERCRVLEREMELRSSREMRAHTYEEESREKLITELRATLAAQDSELEVKDEELKRLRTALDKSIHYFNWIMRRYNAAMVPERINQYMYNDAKEGKQEAEDALKTRP